MKTLIKNGIGFNPPNYEVRPINILIDDDIISQVSEKEIPATPDMVIYDVAGNLIVPGFMDCGWQPDRTRFYGLPYPPIPIVRAGHL